MVETVETYPQKGVIKLGGFLQRKGAMFVMFSSPSLILFLNLSFQGVLVFFHYSSTDHSRDMKCKCISIITVFIMTTLSVACSSFKTLTIGKWLKLEELEGREWLKLEGWDVNDFYLGRGLFLNMGIGPLYFSRPNSDKV